jgi:hypothetical protein
MRVIAIFAWSRQLAALRPGAHLGPEVAGAGDGEPRLVHAGAGEDDTVAERELDHVGVARDLAAAFLDRVDEPGEELPAEEPLRLDHREEVFGHSTNSSSTSLS